MTCPCLDSDDKPKKLYASRNEAEKARTKRELKSPSLILTIYECRKGSRKGFHLSRKKDSLDTPYARDYLV